MLVVEDSPRQAAFLRGALYSKLASKDDSDLSDLEPLDGESEDSDDSRSRRSGAKKKVSFYNPEPDALALAASLKHSTIDPKPIIKILPYLSDDHVLMLRT